MSSPGRGSYQATSSQSFRRDTTENLTEKSDQFLEAPTRNHRRSLSGSSTPGSELGFLDTASERSAWEDSQTELSLQDTQFQKESGLDKSPPGKPSPCHGPFPDGPDRDDAFDLQSGIGKEIDALTESTSISSEIQDPEPLGLFHTSVGKDPKRPYLQDFSNILKPSQSLSDRLVLASVQSCGPDSSRVDQSFYPPSVLAQLLDASTVEKELRRTGKLNAEKCKDLAKYICLDDNSRADGGEVGSFRPIFALLVLTERLDCVQSFLDDNLSSFDLPLAKVVDSGSRIKNIKRWGSSDSEPLQCFSGWQLLKLKSFYNLQWQFVAHRFERSEYNDVILKDLDELRVLPFIAPIDNGCPSSGGVVSLGEGGSGHVMQCYIHPEFHHFDNKEDIDKRGVAVKRLIGKTSAVVFQRELTVLGKFCGEGANDHVVSLLGTYKQSGHYHLVFPRADMNLFEYWQKSPSAQSFTHGGVSWMAKQCAGLALALCLVHKHKTFPKEKVSQHTVHAGPMLSKAHRTADTKLRVSGVIRSSTKDKSPQFERPHMIVEGLHGDVKPENFLIYMENASKDTSVIKLADFGEGEMTPSARGSRTRSDVAMTMSYRAPECDLRPGKIRPASDVWSFGCVLLEMVTWMLGGFDLVEQFGQERLTDDIFHDSLNQGSDTFFDFATSNTTGEIRLGVRVKPKVMKFIAQLHEHERCTQFLHDLLDLIQEKMLLADSTQRRQCTFHKKLQVLHDNCEKDESYSCAPRPQKRSSQPNPLVELHQSDVEEKSSAHISYNITRLDKHRGATRRCGCDEHGTMWRLRAWPF